MIYPPGMALAIEVVKGPSITLEAQADGKSVAATLRWETDVVCGTRLRYGTSPQKLEGKAGEGTALRHEVRLEGLEKDRLYHYAISSAKLLLQTGSFSTQGAAASKVPPPEVAKAKPGASAPQAPRAPPSASVTWGYLPSLQDHFDRHGPDFGVTSKEDYARQAWQFLQRAKAEGLPAKLDESDGTLRVYDPKSGAFAAYNRNGTTKTYFKPGSPGYWSRQPGRPVNLKEP